MNMPNQNVPLIDPTTGALNKQWLQFFSQLSFAVGDSATANQDAELLALYTSAPRSSQSSGGSGTVTSIGAAAATQSSIVVSGSSSPITGSGTFNFALSGDANSPGNTEYYGTNSSGAKGYFPLPTGSAISTILQSGGTSQTYNVPATANVVYVICIGGGGGGGSGCRVLAPTNTASGGTGGGGGSISVNTLRAADVGSSVTVAFSNAATGGNGGAATTATGSGNNGVDGSNVTFGNFCAAAGGHHGSGGTQGGTTGGAAAQTLQANFAIGTPSPNQSTNAIGQPGGSPNSSFVTSTSTASIFSACAGGNGAGLSTTVPSSFAGGAGGGTTFAGGYATQLPGGAGGAIGANGSPGTNGSGTQGGAGGGGGGSSTAGTVGGNGGTGGNYGGGGGGGGACNTVPTSSSAGGNGAPAVCIVIAW